jgi:hypothetical protein
MEVIMQERERVRPSNQRGDGAVPDDDRMADVREAADRLLDHAEQALERAISADSVAFLQANQQTIGQ